MMTIKIIAIIVIIFLKYYLPGVLGREFRSIKLKTKLKIEDVVNVVLSL